MADYDVEAAKVRAAEALDMLYHKAITWDKITVPSWDDVGAIMRWGYENRKIANWQVPIERGFIETPYSITSFQPSDSGPGSVVITEWTKAGEVKFTTSLHVQGTTREQVHFTGLMFNPKFEKQNNRPALEKMAQESGMLYLSLMYYIHTQGEPHVIKEEQRFRHVYRDKSDRKHARKGKKVMTNVVRTNYIISPPEELRPTEKSMNSEMSRMFDQMLTLDKVQFTTLDEMKNVTDWAEANLSTIFDDWNPPLLKGHIEIPDERGMPDAFVVFDMGKSDPKYIELMEFDTQGNLHWMGFLDMAKSSPKGISFENDELPMTAITALMGKDFIRHRIDVGVNLYIFVMGYIRANRNTYVTTVKESVERRVSDKPSVPRKYEPSSVVKIQPRTIYRISAPSGGTSSHSDPKRVYQAESWTVIGHKRRYRDETGKVIKEVEVAPYTKGTGRHKAKTYQI